MKLRTLVLAALLLTPPVFAREICWVERVEATQSGVRVELNQAASLTVWRGPDRVREQSARPVRSFEPAEGDGALLYGGVHDQCRVAAVRKDGHLGIHLDAYSQPHGFPATNVKVFVPAE